MRKIKNEFMAHWDGVLTKGGERVLVLAATNRPFDLDEAIIRRFERRCMAVMSYLGQVCPWISPSHSAIFVEEAAVYDAQ